MEAPARAAAVDVAESSPMRRGLKAGSLGTSPRTISSRRIFPDEEGTERAGSRPCTAWTSRVAESSPMRRGLKGGGQRERPGGLGVAESSPMRRGLKALVADIPALAARCRRIFPDEEGTESRRRPTGRLGAPRRRIFPDEEGTERDDRQERPAGRHLSQNLPR